MLVKILLLIIIDQTRKQSAFNSCWLVVHAWLGGLGEVEGFALIPMQIRNRNISNISARSFVRGSVS